MLIEQIPKNRPKEYVRKTLINIGFNPRVELSEENIVRDLNNHEKIEHLINYLKKSNSLEYERPREMLDAYTNSDKKYVLEEMLATKIVFPEESLRELKGVKEFVLWISDPVSQNISDSNFVKQNTFLYIPEQWLDEEEYSAVHSGCSALQTVVNFLEGRYLTSQHTHGNEVLGRSSYDHPIEKLLGIGAVKLNTKKITCLYKKRYITDEQCYLFNNEGTRVHDMLGYPIFIEEN